MRVIVVVLGVFPIEALRQVRYKEKTEHPLLDVALALGKDPKYHEWVDSALSAGDIHENKKTWHTPNSYGTYWMGQCPEKTSAELRAAAEQMACPSQFVQECHHNFYGGGWGRNNTWMNLVMSTGIKPEQKFFDVGCGAMRLGVPLANYLDAGNYHGLDADGLALRAAIQYEVPIHGLISKKPHLLQTYHFEMSKIAESKSIDVIGAFVVLKKREFFDKFYSEAAKVLKPDGQIIIVQRNTDCAGFLTGDNLLLTRMGELGSKEFTKDGDSVDEMCAAYQLTQVKAVQYGFELVGNITKATGPGGGEDVFFFKRKSVVQ